MRAFLAFLYSLLLAPAAALAQQAQPYPQDTGAGVMTWFWWAIMAVVVFIALMAWGRARGGLLRRRPPAHP